MTLHEFLSLPVNPTAYDIIAFTFNLAIGFVLEGAIGYALYRKLTGEYPPLFGPVSFKKKKGRTPSR